MGLISLDFQRVTSFSTQTYHLKHQNLKLGLCLEPVGVFCSTPIAETEHDTLNSMGSEIHVIRRAIGL